MRKVIVSVEAQDRDIRHGVSICDRKESPHGYAWEPRAGKLTILSMKRVFKKPLSIQLQLN